MAVLKLPPITERIFLFLEEKFARKLGLASTEQTAEEIWRLREKLQETECLSVELQRHLSKLRRMKSDKAMLINTKRGDLLATTDVRYLKGAEAKMIRINDTLKEDITQLQEINSQIVECKELRDLLKIRRSEIKLNLSDTKFISTMKNFTGRIFAQPIADSDNDAVDIHTFIDDEPKLLEKEPDNDKKV